MFNYPFSFRGRITRTEYGVSLMLAFILVVIVEAIVATGPRAQYAAVMLLPMTWMVVAQGFKRCHDIGKPGWWQFIPFYFLWLMFNSPDEGENFYGEDPREMQPACFGRPIQGPSADKKPEELPCMGIEGEKYGLEFYFK